MSNSICSDVIETPLTLQYLVSVVQNECNFPVADGYPVLGRGKPQILQASSNLPSLTAVPIPKILMDVYQLQR